MQHLFYSIPEKVEKGQEKTTKNQKIVQETHKKVHSFAVRYAI